MNAHDKQYQGLVVKAPLHLNPQNNPNRYVFSGFAISTKEQFSCGLSVIPLPGFISPEEFAADIEANLPDAINGDLLAYFPSFKLGKFSYVRPGTGDTVEGKAHDIQKLTPEQLKTPPTQTPTYKTPSPSLKAPAYRPPLQPLQPLPTPRPPRPKPPEQDNGMTPSF